MSEKGKIKWFNQKGGFGKIQREDKDDLFFHITQFEKDIDKTELREGVELVFIEGPGRKGHEAKNINFINVRSNKMNNTIIKIPSDTYTVLKKNSVDNLNLYFNKLPEFKLKKNNDSEEVKLDSKFQFNKFDVTLIDSIKTRMTHSLEIFKKNGYKISNITLKTDWRLIVGLGNESVYETSITLHHIYGIPYIPGSAIKGITRNWIITEYFLNSKGEPDEVAALKHPGFCKIFGTQESQGKVIFFDAFPTADLQIKPDIMNSHYGPYYSGEEPPADYHDTNLIFFLTVVKDTSFSFSFGIKEKDNIKIEDDKFKGKCILDIIQQELKSALQEHGIGAKTAVGYGYF